MRRPPPAGAVHSDRGGFVPLLHADVSVKGTTACYVYERKRSSRGHVKSARTSRRFVATAAAALVALATLQPTAAGSRSDAHQGAARFATVATITTQDFRVAVVARRLDGGSTPTADVRVAVARRFGGSWRESGETRLARPTLEHRQRAACCLSARDQHGRDALSVGATRNGPAAPITVTRLRSHVPRPAQGLSFSQTETCFVLSLVNGSRVQLLQRSHSVMPASRAIRSSSDGHT